MKAEIQEGDIVQVNINAAQVTVAAKARVLHRPVATGDGWRFRDLRTGILIEVSEGCTVTLLEEE